MVVEQELTALGLKTLSVELGEVEIDGELTAEKREEIRSKLESFGFELIDDQKSRWIEQVKTAIVQLIQNENGALKVNLSDYISEHLNVEYSFIGPLFSEVENKTIEKYFIEQRIEKVKELILYNELNLNEIAFQLHFSSVAHLSGQFKKVTGFTPSYFKQIKDKKRRQIEDI